MKVLLVEPGKEARPAEIDGSLKGMQAVVGGLIQAVYPWPEPVALVCNDEGKLWGLPLNRALEGYDIIAGTFFICGLGEEDFCGLNQKQMAFFRDKFQYPEFIQMTSKGIQVTKCTEAEYAALQDKQKHRKEEPKKGEYER